MQRFFRAAPRREARRNLRKGSGKMSGPAMRAVDTNLLVRLLTRDDEKQAASADDFIQGGAWVSHLVLLETSWVLTSVYDVTSKQLMVALEMLLQHESLVIQDAD